MTAPARPAVPYYGSKFSLAGWIESHFPAHHIYVEPFGGAAGVLLGKKPSPVEVYNDIDNQVVNFFRVLRDEAQREQLIALLHLTPYSLAEYHDARLTSAASEGVEAARQFFVRGWQGFGSVGASTDLSNGWSRDKGGREKKRSHNQEVNRWLGAIPNLIDVAERFATVQIDRDTVWTVIDRYDSADTLFYLDPPYVESTLTSSKHYRSRFSTNDHRQLKFALDRIKGSALVSGYPSDFYTSLYADWKCVTKEVLTAGAIGGGKRAQRTECLWLNAHCLTHAEPAR